MSAKVYYEICIMYFLLHEKTIRAIRVKEITESYRRMDQKMTVMTGRRVAYHILFKHSSTLKQH